MPLSVNLSPVGVNPLALPEFDKVSTVMAAQFAACVSALGVGFVPPYTSESIIMGAMSGSTLVDQESQGYDIVVGLSKGFDAWIYLVAAGMMILPTPVTPPASTAALAPPAIAAMIQSQANASYAARKPNEGAPTPNGLEQPFFQACGTYIYNIYAAP